MSAAPPCRARPGTRASDGEPLSSSPSSRMVRRRAGAGELLPGARGLEEGHELALVVRAPRATIAGRSTRRRWRVERRPFPQLERVDRLHVVVAVEEDVRARPLRAALGVAHHHRMPGVSHRRASNPISRSSPTHQSAAGWHCGWRRGRSRCSRCGSARTAARAPVRGGVELLEDLAQRLIGSKAGGWSGLRAHRCPVGWRLDGKARAT